MENDYSIRVTEENILPTAGPGLFTLARSENTNRPYASLSSTKNSSDNRGISYREAAELIAQSLSGLKVYVVESEITEAQRAVKSIVSQSTF